MVPPAADAAPPNACTSPAKGAFGIGLSYGASYDEYAAAPEGLLTGRIARLRRGGAVEVRVRVVPTTTGRSRLVLCAGPTRVASLPDLPRGTQLDGVSGDDRVLVWHVTRHAARGQIVEGQLTGHRIRIVRRTTSPATDSAVRRPRDGRIAVAPNGDAAWALTTTSGSRKTTMLWVWPHDAPVRGVALTTAQHRDLASVQLTDDQHLVIGPVGGSSMAQSLIAFAPPTPGTCAHPTSGNWSPLGGWLVRTVNTFTDYLTFANDVTMTCDPGTGRVLRLERGGESWSQYCSEYLDTTRAVRIGPWLVLERRAEQAGMSCNSYHYTSTVTDTTTGHTQLAAGALVGPNAAAPLDPTDESSRFADGAGSAVVFVDGTIAWTRYVKATGRFHVVLADAHGRRVVGTATQPYLTLDSDLHWHDGDAVRSAPITPATGWARAVTDLTP